MWNVRLFNQTNRMGSSVTDFFTPEDFHRGPLSIGSSKIAAELANIKLSKQRVVYANEHCAGLEEAAWWPLSTYDREHGHNTTHRALLVNIQPVECAHDAVKGIINYGEYKDEYTCVDCNAKLKPTGWRVI